MKTYFKKGISNFCIDDEAQNYIQVNISTSENAIIKGANPKVLELLMGAVSTEEALTEEEFNSKRDQVLSVINS